MTIKPEETKAKAAQKEAEAAQAETAKTEEAKSVDDVREEAKRDLETQHKREMEELQKRQERELIALDPNVRSLDKDALDATRPRGPEAPYETMKPSQRQGQSIETLPAPPVLEKPHDPTTEVVPETK